MEKQEQRVRTNNKQRRAFERIPASLECNCFDINHFGTVTDLSEKGMFLRSHKIHLPFEMQFQVNILLQTEVLNVPVKVKRITKSNSYYDGIGVELLEPTENYLNFIKHLRSNR